MSSMNFIKQFFAKHYPRDHLYLAGGLVALFLLVLIIPSSEKGTDVTETTSISIPVSFRGERSPSKDTTEVAQSADTLANTLPAGTNELTQALEYSDFIVQVDLPPSEDVLSENLKSAWKNIEVQQGDNLSAIFTKVGLSDQDLFRVLNSSDEAKVLNKLYPGYKLDFMIPNAGELEQLRVLKSPLEGYLFTRLNSSYQVESILKEAQMH